MSIQFWTRRYLKSFPIFPNYFQYSKSFHYGLACLPPWAWEPSLISPSGRQSPDVSNSSHVHSKLPQSPVVIDKIAFRHRIRTFSSKVLLTAHACSKGNLGETVFLSTKFLVKQVRATPSGNKSKVEPEDPGVKSPQGQRPLRGHSCSNFI